MARLEDLNLSSEPLDAEARRFIDEINELLDDDGYRWAWDTLGGIRESVRESQRVSSGQRRAVENICAGQARGLGRSRSRSRSRRYEGFSR